MRLHPALLSCFAHALCCLTLEAAVTTVDVTERGTVLNAAAFGQTGPYEALTGRIHFAIDPHKGPNRIIADIDLAPRNTQGLVEFSADLYLLRPVNPAQGNRTALIEISNRGGKALTYEFNFAHGPFDPGSPEAIGDAFLMQQGFTLVWIGWEFDVPPSPKLLRAYLPVATEAGTVITGLVRSEWTGEHRETTIPLGDKGQIGYSVLQPDSPENRLLVRDDVGGERTAIPHAQWKFSDPNHVSLQGAFTPGRIYETVYRASNPPVAGLGLAAVRDFVSFLKFGGSQTALSDAHLNIAHAIAFGVSQSGRFLREYLYDGFNEDEQHRQVFDAIWAHVAGAGRGSFNARFAQPSRDGHAFNNIAYPVDVAPFDEEHLLQAAHRAHVVPKLFLTNGSYEYWSRCASLIHTTIDAKADAPPSEHGRIYFFSGSQHTVGSIPPAPAPAQNRTNVNDYRFGLRALLLALTSWVAQGTDPPPSQFPKILKGELTPLTGLHFPALPGIAIPQHKREAYRLDFSAEPPVSGPAYPTLVPQVDQDGNDLGGIRMPEVAVPLAAYTGWNLRNPDIGAPSQLMPFLGSWIPFKTARYTREEYLIRIDQAAKNLIRSGFALEADRNSLTERAAKEWDYLQSMQPR